MRAHARTALGLAALAFLSLAPAGALWGQQRAIGQLVGEINEALAGHPAEAGAFQVRLLADGVLEARRTDASGVVERRAIYFEDIASVTQTRRGHVFVECDEDLGDCAKQTCFGEYANWIGCTRAGRAAAEPSLRLSDVLVIEYAYDTRAYRQLEAAFDELLEYDLDAISAAGERQNRR